MQLPVHLITEDFLKSAALKSIENAKSLIDDADLLKENGRIQRAYTLYQLATEEIGKAVFSYILLIPAITGDVSKEEYAKEFFRHQLKSSRSKSMDFIVTEVLHTGNPEKALNFLEQSHNEDPKTLDRNKNYSLYTSEVNGEVKRPDELITKEMMHHIALRAITRYKAAEPYIKLGLLHLQEIKDYSEKINNKDYEISKMAEDFWKRINKNEPGPK